MARGVAGRGTRMSRSDEAFAPDGSPVQLYLALPGADEAAFIHRLIPDGATILELGCGAGRVTRHLAELGHVVTAVDNGPGMLRHLVGVSRVEPVLADIETLNLSPRRWPVVLLASHLINTDAGPRMLETAGLHCASGGELLVQRHEPGWVDSVTESLSKRPGLVIEMDNIVHERPGRLTADMAYEIDGQRSRQSFVANEVDDEMISTLAADVGCEVVETIGVHRKWVRLRPRHA